MKKVMIILIVLITLLVVDGLVTAEEEIVAQIVAVNSRHNTILIKNEGRIIEYTVAMSTPIYLNGKSVSLAALQPITPTSFQEAKLKIDNDGQIKYIASFYKAIPIEVKEIRGEEVILEDLNTKENLIYTITNNVKILRNNSNASVSNISEGDQGLVILGVNNSLQKLILHHYEVSGMLTEIDYSNKIITVNVGSRLKPKFKKFHLSRETRIFNKQGTIKLEDLSIRKWIKIELDNEVRSIRIRRV